MRVSAEVDFRAPREVVWDIVTDIEHAGSRVAAIDQVEILARPAAGLPGLKWRETRTMFGRPAMAVMWVTDVAEGSRFDTRAEEQGMVYTTRTSIEETADGTRLRREFMGVPQTLGAKVMGSIFGVLLKGSMRKALQKDLEDLKAAAEARVAAGERAPTSR